MHQPLPDLSQIHIMGILNCTPDSFSDGGNLMGDSGRVSIQQAVDAAGDMIQSGATILDIGGESTRPGSEPVDTNTELERVIPVIETLKNVFPHVCLSADTTKFEVAEAALKSGAQWINDVSGLRKEPRFISLCAENHAGLVIMHSVGNPKTMQENPIYDDVVAEVGLHLFRTALEARQAGVPQVIIDPGIGFGKTLDHNLELLKNLDVLSNGDYPVLIGVSRKSMIGQILGGRPASDRLTGTIIAHYHALTKGARILRVHDVKEAADSVAMFNALHR